jgi:hypothetical protein
LTLRGRILLAILIAAVGLVWIGQGTGILGGSSFMVGDPLWAWIGVVLVVAGVGLGVVTIRRRAP